MKKGFLKILTLTIVTIILSSINAPRLFASSGTITMRSDRTTVVIGSTVTVTVVASSSEPLGGWEWTIQYDRSKLKLESGEAKVADVGDGSATKSKTYTYKFKTIAKGSSTISLGGVSGYAWNAANANELMSFRAGSVKITAITQAELEASYSKNNNLSSLGVEGYTLNQEFNKDTLEYTVSVPSDVEKITLTGTAEDGKSSINGLGEFEVSEGENKFDIIVTAENGSQKTYTIKVNVEDKNPIEVIIDGKKYTVIKRASTLTAPSTYEATTERINDIEVPAFKSNITNYVLVGLKGEDGTSNLYIYDGEYNKYTLYTELKTEGMLLFPKKAPTSPKYYKITKVTINGTEIEAYQYDGVEDYYLVYGVNIETGSEGFYQYDMVNNTITRYNDKIINELTKKNENFLMIIIILGVETIVIIMILLITLTKRGKKDKIKVKKVTFKDLDKELNEPIQKEDTKTVKEEKIEESKTEETKELEKNENTENNNNKKEKKNKRK